MRVQAHERATRGERLAERLRLQESLGHQAQESQSDTGRLLWLIDQSDGPAIEQRAQQTHTAFSFAGLILAVLGLLSGVALGSAVFYYDGRSPVNIIAVLGVFVVLQGALLLLAALAALPRAWARRLPGLEGVQEALRLASPGRLALLGARLLPQDLREALLAAIGRSGAHQRVYGRVQLWAILRWSQLYAVVLNLAAAATFVYLVSFSDLAFGWSTTLKIEPAQMHRIVHGVALPWSWNETLTPSLELVERSRYFRGTPFEPEQRGGWWPFVLAVMLVYGLLPRVIALLIASRRLQVATQKALVATPGASDLLCLLDGSDHARAEENGDTTASTAGDGLGPIGSGSVVIDWSRAAGSSVRAASLLGFEPARYEPAGGARSIGEDRDTVERIARSAGQAGVAVMVKLWEPPVIETTEFLKALRAAVSGGLPVRVVPVACDGDGRVVGETGVLLEQWRRRVSALGDPWTAVAQPVGLSPRRQEPADD